MKILIEYLDGNGSDTGSVIDISDNLYWFEENFVREMDENGFCEGHRGEKYRVIALSETEPTQAIKRHVK